MSPARRDVLSILAAGLLGGLLSSSLVFAPTLAAQDAPQARRAAGVLIRDVGFGGRRGAQLAKLAGEGAGLYFFDEKDHGRLNGGIYPENPALPFLALGPDNATNAVKGLLRLAGPNHSGVVVIKDNADRDRIVLGLGLGDPDEEPFLVYYDKSGKKTVFGLF